ncbi:MAG: hypothetical protein AABZ47_03080 [Planctomycetota bacterium]
MVLNTPNKKGMMLRSFVVLTVMYYLANGTLAQGQVSTRSDQSSRPSPPATASKQVLIPNEAAVVELLSPLKPLQKVHYSWPLPNSMLEQPDGRLLREYVRLSHAVTISGEWCIQQHVVAAVQACKRENAETPSIPASLALCFKPWHRRFGKELPVTDCGPSHQAELVFFQERITTIRDWLAAANKEFGARIEVTALLFDSERLYARPNDAEWNKAITQKYDAFYDIGKRVFPNARIEWYGRGIQRTAHSSGWSSYGWNTFDNKADSFSCSLYRVAETDTMRESFRRTVELAKKSGKEDVTPWVALGSGYKPHARKFQEWTSDWDYDLIHSWTIGAEINDPRYGAEPERYAPWNAAKVVVFYPQPFDPRTPSWAKHFVAYVRGANGIEALPKGNSK